MWNKYGKGAVSSLRARIAAEVKEHTHQNKTLFRARNGAGMRLFRWMFVARSIPAILTVYGLFDLVLAAIEATHNLNASHFPGWYKLAPADSLTEIGNYLLAVQVGLLAVISAAIGIVTFISQRNDGNAARTETRLYYVESHAYEALTSFVALAIVLVIQLFWPLQQLLHQINLGGPELIYKAVLTVAHGAWLCLNLVIFYKFMVTTLEFLEPNARERLRERYSANVIIPKSVEARLTAVYWHSAMKGMGFDELDDGPAIVFGSRIYNDKDGKAVFTKNWTKPHELYDIWLVPLGIALRSWQRRVRKITARGATMFSGNGWSGALQIAVSPGTPLEGKVVVVLCLGDVPLTPLEQRLIEWSMKFRAVPRLRRELPLPEEFIEGLVDQVIGQVDRRATKGFDALFDELVRYHTFILSSQDSTDEDGNPINLAQITDRFERPDLTMIRDYRRLFAAAAAQIAHEDHFLNRLSYLVYRLISRKAGAGAPAVSVALLELGIHQVIEMTNWMVRHSAIVATGPGPSVDRTMSAEVDRMSYQKVLLDFIGGWEHVLLAAKIILAPARREERDDPALLWAGLIESVPFFRRYLGTTAYFVAFAAANGDAEAAARYRDMLLRSLDRDDHDRSARTTQYVQPVLHAGQLIRPEWADVETTARELLRHPEFDHVQPGAAYALAQNAFFEDVVCAVGLVLLKWHISDEEPYGTLAETARLTLHYQVLEDEGSRLATSRRMRNGVFNRTIGSVLRQSLDWGSGAPFTGIDGVIKEIRKARSRSFIAGRVYSGWGGDGIESLEIETLAVMAGTLPATGDDGVSLLLEHWLAKPSFLENDKAMQSVIAAFNRLISAIDVGLDAARFEKGVRVFTATGIIDDLRDRLRAVLVTLRDLVENTRNERLRTTPIDVDRVNTIRERVTARLLARSFDIAPFGNVPTVSSTDAAHAVGTFNHGWVYKEEIVAPPMSTTSLDDLVQIIELNARASLDYAIWQSWKALPKARENVRSVGFASAFWRRVQALVPIIPGPPVLLVNESIGEAMDPWTYDAAAVPAGMVTQRDPERAGADGLSYITTADGVAIYTYSRAGPAYLLSGAALTSLIFERLPSGELLNINYSPDTDTRGRFVVEHGLHAQWDSSPVYEFHFRTPRARAAPGVAS